MMCLYCGVRPILSRGRCSKCYRIAAARGEITVKKHGPTLDRCSVEGCENAAYGLTYCRMHYMRHYRHGDPRIVLPPGPEARHAHK